MKEASKRSRRSSGAVTLTEVARFAGVAPITVSRAINTPDKVSAGILHKVREAIEHLGYVPNRMATSLASARSRLIAAIVPNTVMSVFSSTIESLNNTLFEAGYQLLLGQTNYSSSREDQLIESLVGHRPDGILLTGILRQGPGRARLAAAGIPTIETWDLTPDPIDMLIGFSHSGIGREVAHYLHCTGRRRFAVITAGDERAKRRRVAFVNAARKLGCPDPLTVNVGASRSLRSGREALDAVLAQMPDIDAVFCSSDLLALGAMTGARARGVSIPDDLAVVGFGDAPFAADLSPSLTTVRINGEEIGRLAAQFLMARAEGRDVPDKIVDVGFSMLRRESA